MKFVETLFFICAAVVFTFLLWLYAPELLAKITQFNTKFADTFLEGSKLAGNDTYEKFFREIIPADKLLVVIELTWAAMFTFWLPARLVSGR